jgi:hypothetical protein
MEVDSVAGLLLEVGYFVVGQNCARLIDTVVNSDARSRRTNSTYHLGTQSF